MKIYFKWRILRYLAKQRVLSFKRMMRRMYFIQELVKLDDYNIEKLGCLSNRKIKKLFIKEYPNTSIPHITYP